MNLLIGATGYVGGTILKTKQFDAHANSTNMGSFRNKYFDLIVCAGLPGQKWLANAQPIQDIKKISKLSQHLDSISAARAILISTIDVFENSFKKTELDSPDIFREIGYGVNRARFEIFFRNRFPNSSIVRLPALFSPDLRKNFIFDLLNNRAEQIYQVSPKSTFQYFNLSLINQILEIVNDSNIKVLNVSSEPITAYEIAEIFGYRLKENETTQAHYDFRSIHASLFGGENGYLFTKSDILDGIIELKESGLRL